ncbi:MAG: type II secretion system secretin GspD [Desulfocurvibacter africanus]
MHMRHALTVLLLITVGISSCADFNRNETFLPVGNMVDRKGPEQSARKSEFGPQQPDSAQPDTGDVLAEVEQSNRRLNARLDKVLSGESRRVQRVKEMPEEGDGGQQVAFDYLNADIAEVTRLILNQLGANYILHPGVKGSVSVHVSDTLTRAQIEEMLQALLRMNGAIMLRDGELWNVVPLSEAPALAPLEGIFLSGEGRSPTRGQVVRAFKLDYMPAAEIMNVIKPFLSKGALVYANDERGLLLVCDFPHSLLKIEQVINLFDVSVFADMHMRVYTLRYVPAADMTQDLQDLALSTGINTPKGVQKVTFLAMERLNMVLVVARTRSVLDFVDIWVEELDQDIPQLVRAGRAENIFVYYVQNGDAEEIVKSLEGVFARQTEGRAATAARQEQNGQEQQTQRAPGAAISPAQQGQQPGQGQVPIGQQIAQQREAPQGRPRGPSISGELTGEVAFVVDVTTNSILTRANTDDYRTVLSVIEKLDIYPKQVLIEVIIAEVSLDDETQLGIDWRYLLDLTGNASIDFSLSNTPATLNSGLAVTLVDGDRLRSTLRALATKNRTQILSSPHILSSNHSEATIDIGQEVPILTQVTETTDPTTSETTTSVQQNIQYRNTGILLSVTPHINERGLVRMELSQEISSIEDTSVGAINSPLFRKRLATTTVVVNDEQTIVIGGLMEQTNTNNENNVPLMHRIPLLKYLFGYEINSIQNRELLIFITPHVVESREDNDFISKNFIKRLQSIKRSMLKS